MIWKIHFARFFRATCEFLYLIICDWQPTNIEKFLPNVMETLRSGLNDADQDTRMWARKVFDKAIKF